MFKPIQLMIDAGLAAGLLLALALVYNVDNKSVPAPSPRLASPGDTLKFTLVSGKVPKQQPAPAKPLRLAVTPPVYDDMGRLLTMLGQGYQFTNVSNDDLRNPQLLSNFDVVFLTCAISNSTDTGLNANFRKFVELGGTLYASDLRFDLVRGAFPQFVDTATVGVGTVQYLTANVVEPGLQELLGPRVQLHFNSPDWKVAAFKQDMVTTYMNGTYQGRFGSAFAPLLVKFRYGRGTVIFTSFHNAAQNTAFEEKLLKYLVFTAVTAKEESAIAEKMISLGITPKESNLLSASAESRSVSGVYRSQKAGRLQAALGFSLAGARLRLTLTAPDKKVGEAEGTSSFMMEVEDAPAGEWRYVVTALQGPDNLPFTLTFGEPK